MNLAFCLFKYFPFGGLQRDFIHIARECLARNHTIQVYTMHWDGPLEPGLNVTTLPPKGLQNITRIQHFSQSVDQILKSKPYDLIVGFNKMPGLDVYYAADTCFQAKARQQHGAWYQYTPRYRGLVAFESAVFAPQSHTHILSISPLQQPEFERYYQTPSERFHLLPPGITQDRMAPPNADQIRAECRKEFNIREEDYLLLMVGSGFKTKGLDRILKGVASLPEEIKNRTHLWVIGKDHAEAYQKQAQKLNISNQVLFLGGRDDVPRFLLSADLLLHPAYNENTGTVLLEALISGLPVLTTDVCGYAHYVLDAKAGSVLSSPFDQNTFNVALKNMLISPERTQWKQNALTFAKTADIFSMPKHAVDIIEYAANFRS